MPETVEKKTIDALRAEIDSVDRQLVRLLARRAQLAHEVGCAKGASHVYRPEREREIIERAVEENRRIPSRLSSSQASQLFQDIIAACRAVEGNPKVAYLGPKGTFTEMAVLAQFGAGVESIPCATTDEVFREAESGSAAFAVVPVENSTQGTVLRTMDLLFSTPLTIIAEVNVGVRHNLLNKSGRIEDVKRVSAHPQALGQCHKWLAEYLPGVEKIPAASNAAAAVEASCDEGLAAIASSRAAQLYSLQIVSAGIQDDPGNKTRFIVLGHDATGVCRSVPSKTSIVFSVPHQAGSLYRALAILEHHRVNMLRLESRPSRNGIWSYNFYTDIEGHRDTPGVREALDEMYEHTTFFKILGSYPVGADF